LFKTHFSGYLQEEIFLSNYGSLKNWENNIRSYTPRLKTFTATKNQVQCKLYGWKMESSKWVKKNLVSRCKNYDNQLIGPMKNYRTEIIHIYYRKLGFNHLNEENPVKHILNMCFNFRKLKVEFIDWLTDLYIKQFLSLNSGKKLICGFIQSFLLFSFVKNYDCTNLCNWNIINIELSFPHLHWIRYVFI